MDSLCLDLQFLLLQLETVTEQCLIWYRDVEVYGADDASIRRIIIDKNWGWILKLIDTNNFSGIFRKVMLYMYAYGDEEIFRLQARRSRLQSMYIKFLASIVKGDIEFYKENVDSMSRKAVSLGILPEQLHYALLYNQTQIIDIFMTRQPRFIDKHYLNYLINPGAGQSLTKRVSPATLAYFWTILVNRRIVDEDDIDFKQKFESMSALDKMNQ